MLVGAVLTGGSSRRMGRTKALIEVEGVPMASIVAEALVGAGCESVAAIGGEPDELSGLDIAVLPDEYPGQGPLGGVISALGSCSGAATAVVVVACDLPWISGSDLLALVAAARDNPAADVVVARTTRLEPACGVWNLGCLPILREMFAGGERALHPAIAQLSSVEVAVDERAMRNVNTPSDLHQ
jgi:molybdopterin-guanine dinucleotide biosynthesis protein A